MVEYLYRNVLYFPCVPKAADCTLDHLTFCLHHTDKCDVFCLVTVYLTIPFIDVIKPPVLSLRVSFVFVQQYTRHCQFKLCLHYLPMFVWLRRLWEEALGNHAIALINLLVLLMWCADNYPSVYFIV